MPKRSSSEINEALNAPSSDEEEYYDDPANMWMWHFARGRPFSEEEKRGGKIVTYKEICQYMKSVRIRDDNHKTELLNYRYENEALQAQVRQYRRKTQKIERLAHAAVERDNFIHDTANLCMEDGTHAVARPIESDDEDKKPCNAVVYSSAKEVYSDEK